MSGRNYGTGLTLTVSIVLIVLRLVGVTDWSWWWVTAPLWLMGLGALFGIPTYLLVRKQSQETQNRFWYWVFPIIFAASLGLIFIILRLTGTIGWSWWAVTAPLSGTGFAYLINGLIHLLTSTKSKEVREKFRDWSSGPVTAASVAFVFIVLRLLGITDWSWWWVTAPLWAAGFWYLIAGLCALAKRGKNRLVKKQSQETQNRFWYWVFPIIIATSLGLIFIILRLLGVTNWSWWAVTAPLWGAGFVYLINGLIHLLTSTKSKEEREKFRAWISNAVSAASVAFVFIVLRLLDVTDWSWWWVTAPLWTAGFLYLVGGLFALAKRGKK